MATYDYDWSGEPDGALDSNFWTVEQGSFAVASGVAESTGTGGYNWARYIAGQMDSADVFIEAPLGGQGGTDVGAVAARMDSSIDCYGAFWIEGPNPGSLQLRRFDAGSEVSIATGTASANTTTQQDIGVECDGSTIAFYEEGAEAFTVEDSTHTSGRDFGIGIYGDNGQWPSIHANDLGGGDISGSASQTLPAFTQSATASLIFTASADQTLASLTQSASGTNGFSGSAAQTLPSVTQSVSGELVFSGPTSQLLASITQAASGGLTFEGTAAQTLASIVQSASGSSGSDRSGSIAQTLPVITQDGSAELLIEGGGTSLLPAINQQASEVQEATTGTARRVSVTVLRSTSKSLLD